MMTYVDAKMQGDAAIIKHLTVCFVNIYFYTILRAIMFRMSWCLYVQEVVSFKKVSHNVLSLDAQPTGPGILVFITGHIRVCFYVLGSNVGRNVVFL